MMFAGRKVSIIYVGIKEVLPVEGFCKTFFSLAGVVENCFEIELENGRRYQFMAEKMDEKSVQGKISAGLNDLERRITLI